MILQTVHVDAGKDLRQARVGQQAVVEDVDDGRDRPPASEFTSASQVHMLFQIARDEGRSDEVREALQNRTVVAAVGPVCAAALLDHGVTASIQPDRPKMVPLVMSLCAYASAFTASAAKPDPR